MTASLQEIAALLGGHVDGDRVLCPGPNHSSGDRSLVVTPARNANGFTVRSFALDDPATCVSYIKARLGGDLAALAELPARNRADEDKQRAERIARAMEIWDESVSPIGTPVESYLWGSRHLDLPEDVAGEVVRYHPRCWWSDELTKKPFQTHAMVCAMRDIRTDEIVAVQRARLDLVEREGVLVEDKRDRRMLGAGGRRSDHARRRRRGDARASDRRGCRDLPDRATARSAAGVGARERWRYRRLPRPARCRMPHHPRRT